MNHSVPKTETSGPTGHRPRPRKARSAHHTLLFGLKKVPKRNWYIAGGVLALAAAGVAILLVYTEFDWRALMRQIGDLHALPLILAMAVLPIFGFPIVPVYLVAGVRFGPWWGGAVVALATAAHLLGSYVIARSFLRRPIERLLARYHVHLPDIPRDEQPAVAVIAALVPGLPYFVRHYLLAVAGVQLRIYFWICLPIYVARSYVSILLGDLGTEPDRTRLIVLGAFETAKVVICGGVLWWLRQHHRRVHGEHHDEHGDASPQPIP